MQLDDVFGRDARGLMEVVDILGDDRTHLAGAIKASESEMPAAGLCLRELLLHGKAPAPSLVTHLLARQKLVERDRPVLRPQSARGTKVWNSALGRNPRAGEGQHHLRAFDKIA